MRFITILEDLKRQYADNCTVRKNGTILLAPGKIPNCKHMLFAPISEQHLTENIADYANVFPSELAHFLRYSNGADLCWVRLVVDENCKFASTLLNIYGFPPTPPFARLADREECFSVRIEDLARHKQLPRKWLKCGNYSKNYDFHHRHDIFIDTETGKVYSVIKNENEIIDQWETLDECFCDIFMSFADAKEEYLFQP